MASTRQNTSALQRVAVEACGEEILMLTGLGATETAPFAITTGREGARSGMVGVPGPGVELKVAAVGSKLEARVRELALTISNNAPLSVGYSKFTIAQALRDPADRAMTKIAQLFDECFSSADYAEGRRAFMEKRQPKFTGK